MKKEILPTMSIFGFSTDPGIITEKLFMYFITSEHSQSVTFYNKISSLKYLLTKYATDPDELKNEIEDTLIVLYKKYFYKVSVNVEVEVANATGYINIDIETITSKGDVNRVTETLKTTGTTITNILDLIYR